MRTWLVAVLCLTPGLALGADPVDEYFDLELRCSGETAVRPYTDILEHRGGCTTTWSAPALIERVSAHCSTSSGRLTYFYLAISSERTPVNLTVQAWDGAYAAATSSSFTQHRFLIQTITDTAGTLSYEGVPVTDLFATVRSGGQVSLQFLPAEPWAGFCAVRLTGRYLK